jgi:hypothetical protein
MEPRISCSVNPRRNRRVKLQRKRRSAWAMVFEIARNVPSSCTRCAEYVGSFQPAISNACFHYQRRGAHLSVVTSYSLHGAQLQYLVCNGRVAISTQSAYLNSVSLSHLSQPIPAQFNSASLSQFSRSSHPPNQSKSVESIQANPTQSKSIQANPTQSKPIQTNPNQSKPIQTQPANHVDPTRPACLTVSPVPSFHRPLASPSSCLTRLTISPVLPVLPVRPHHARFLSSCCHRCTLFSSRRLSCFLRVVRVRTRVVWSYLNLERFA